MAEVSIFLERLYHKITFSGLEGRFPSRLVMVWPLIMGAARTYAPYVVLPIAVVVGSVGYFIETRVRNSEKWAKEKPSTLEERTLRQLDALEDPTDVQSLKYKEGIPRTMFDRNQGYKTGFTGRSLELGERSTAADTNNQS